MITSDKPIDPMSPYVMEPERPFAHSERWKGRINVGWSNFRALHYGEQKLPGRTYEAYTPPLSYPPPRDV